MATLRLDPGARRRLDDLAAALHSAVQVGFLGPREGSRLWPRHIDDALGLACVREPRPAEHWFDLGAGAGLPGLPLAAAFPATLFLLIEVQHRKADWLRNTAAALGFGNVEVREERLEETGRSALRGTADVVTARALARLSVSAELGIPLLRRGGVMLIPRGRIRPVEWAELLTAARLLGAGEVTTIPNRAASGPSGGDVVMMRKLAATPQRFPRRVGIPKRDPLGSEPARDIGRGVT